MPVIHRELTRSYVNNSKILLELASYFIIYEFRHPVAGINRLPYVPQKSQMACIGIEAERWLRLHHSLDNKNDFQKNSATSFEREL